MRFLILFLLFLSACSRGPSKQDRLTARVQSWYGDKEILLIERWGVATASQDVDAQHKILTYVVNEKGFTFRPALWRSGSYELNCQVNFTISKESGAVLRGYWEGHLDKCWQFIKESPNGVAANIAH